MQRNRGVTLVELVTTLAVVALLATLAAPSFRELGRRAAVLSATHAVMSALHTTRSASITRGRPGILCLTASDNACLTNTARVATGYLAWIDAGTQRGQFDASDTLLMRASLPGDIAIRGSRTYVTFWPVARAGTTNTLSICDLALLAAPAQVVVSPSGRPRLATTNPSACR